MPTPRIREMYKVVLKCGHQVSTRNPPMHDRVTYSCPAAGEHGHLVPWLEYISPQGRNRINKQTNSDTKKKEG